MIAGLGVLVALAGGPSAWGVAPDDRVVAELTDGRVVEGWFMASAPGVLQLTEGGEVVVVPLSLVARATVDGAPVTGDALRADLARVAAPDRGGPGASAAAPAPGLVTALSLTWPGLGHAALGDWGAAAGYAGVTGVFWGTGVWAVRQEQLGVLLPLVGLDLLFRGWSASEARRLALRRQNRTPGAPAEPGVPPPPSRGGLTAPAAGE